MAATFAMGASLPSKNGVRLSGQSHLTPSRFLYDDTYITFALQDQRNKTPYCPSISLALVKVLMSITLSVPSFISKTNVN